ncbi:HTH-type transcriptional regulator SinR [compost metagenome]
MTAQIQCVKKQALRKKFGSKIRQLRKARGLSQEAFADQCGYARSYMGRIEGGIANPSLDAIEVLAAALRVPVAELFEGA